MPVGTKIIIALIILHLIIGFGFIIRLLGPPKKENKK
jgi:hypothetical protein